jgi:hypothetical protein
MLLVCTGLYGDHDGGDMIANSKDTKVPSTAFSTPGMYKFLGEAESDERFLNDNDFQDYEDYMMLMNLIPRGCQFSCSSKRNI